MIMFFFPHKFPEFWNNFGISVPRKMNNKIKKNPIFLFIYLFFLSKECYFWVLAFLVDHGAATDQRSNRQSGSQSGRRLAVSAESTRVIKEYSIYLQIRTVAGWR